MLSRIGGGIAVLGAMLILAWQLWPRSMPSGRTSSQSAATIEGHWRCLSTLVDGKAEATGLWYNLDEFKIEGNTIVAPQTFAGSVSFSLPTTPADGIDISLKSDAGEAVVIRGIFSLETDTLRLRLPLDTKQRSRPIGYDTRPGDGTTVFVLARIKPGEVRLQSVGEQLGAILRDARHENRSDVEREQLAARCLKLADDHPGTEQAVVALLWTLANAPDGPSAKAALTRLKGGGIAEADLETLDMCSGINRGSIGPGDIPGPINRELAPLLLERVLRTPDHPKAAAILSSVCLYTRVEDAADVSPVFDAAARMIAERWQESPDLTHFLESLSAVAQCPWASQYEPTVRAILSRTPNAYIRCRAAFTLAQLVAETGEARQEEARELYVQFVNSYKPGIVDPEWADLTEDMVEQARREIDALLIRGVGGPAPDLRGNDLDGKPMDLGEFRGEVVLLSFWGSWCNPCMKLIPHERQLVEQLRGRPFAIVGVNGDDMGTFDRQILEKHAITWRSFQNDRPGRKSIANEWNLTGWPTLYLIEHTGTIRRRWIGIPSLAEFDHEIERWVSAAEGKPLPPAFRTGKVAEVPMVQGLPAKFLDRVHTDKELGESKYAICVPENYDGKTPLPIVLFLHGSGQVGTDNNQQRDIGFGPALRTRGMPFACLGVFPQAREASWLAGSPDGKRAVAILEAVEREFPTDKKRVYLTGVSMGAEGVWSLAAAAPRRFAAIVPVCGGGDPNLAEALKTIPCWAFHGDADKIVPVQASRDLIQAITKAGGQPLYQEYRGLDHNCWDRAYAEVELYNWLQAQVLP